MTDFDNWQDIPHILHDLHIDYPLAAERLMINKVEKLAPNLNDRERYVVHDKALKLYESLSLKMESSSRNQFHRRTLDEKLHSAQHEAAYESNR